MSGNRIKEGEPLLSLAEVAVSLVGKKQWKEWEEWIENGDRIGDGRFGNMSVLSRMVSVRRGLLTIVDERLHALGVEYPGERKKSVQDPVFVERRSGLLDFRRSMFVHQSCERDGIRRSLNAVDERQRRRRLPF